jgi:hypothetical protein
MNLFSLYYQDRRGITFLCCSIVELAAIGERKAAFAGTRRWKFSLANRNTEAFHCIPQDPCGMNLTLWRSEKLCNDWWGSDRSTWCRVLLYKQRRAEAFNCIPGDHQEDCFAVFDRRLCYGQGHQTTLQIGPMKKSRLINATNELAKQIYPITRRFYSAYTRFGLSPWNWFFRWLFSHQSRRCCGFRR